VAGGVYPELEARPEPPRAVVRSLSPFPTLATPTIANAEIVKPGDAAYAVTLPLHNKRNDVQPSIRILCSSTQAVSDSVKWVRGQGLSLALRSGGHCYEGFSQSPGVVIDVRRMGLVTLDQPTQSVYVSAGATLGKVYDKVAAAGFAIAAGSCRAVGVSGHTLGGGQGLLGRRYGLTADNLLGLRVVDAQGAIREIDATHDADLFWAMRGGGGGGFAVATRFRFRMHALATVHTFSVSWTFPSTETGLTRAGQIFDAWQRWAPQAPNAIMAIMTAQKPQASQIKLRVFGQTTGTRAQLESQLNANVIVRAPTVALSVVTRSFIAAANKYGGGDDPDPVYMDAKSDVVTSPLGTTAIRALLDAIIAIPSNNVVAICDPYGGAIADVAANATAFPHRGISTYVIQYYANWGVAADTPIRVPRLAQVHAAMRPYMSGGAYVNYCDMDLAQSAYPQAYWGANLTRLKQVKQAVDPTNFFRHGQSVPLV
jgi:FAD/FMN-containing dehydrogenase